MIDGKTNTATNVKAGSSDAILVMPSRSEVYLLGYESDSLKLLKEETQAISKIPTGITHLWGMVALGKTLYVAHMQDATVAAIDMETHTVREIPTPGMPAALAVDAERKEIYVACYGDGSVSAIDSRLGTVIWTVKLGEHPQALVVDTERRLIYVANAQGHMVNVINAAKAKLMKTYVVAGSPYALALDIRTHRVVAATMGQTAYAVIPQIAR